MRTLRMSICAAIVLAALAVPAAAAPGSRGDAVIGVGYRLLDGERRVQYTVSVKVGRDDRPTGSFLYRNVAFNLTFGGTVACVDVEGHRAAIGGRITHVQSEEPANQAILGLSYLVFFEDNGFPQSRGQAGPDIVSQTYILPGDAVDVPGDFPATCPDAATTAHDAYDFERNFVVVDR